jgi:predicted RNase H-like HicB family nuclease
MKYLVIYEKSTTSWGAYAPDLPGLGVEERRWTR